MLSDLVRYLLPIVGVVSSAMAGGSDADQLIVFVSSFAPDDDGAIHAFRLEPGSGQLKPVGRTTEMEHPFFMAISPDCRFLYAVHAPGKFGGESHEQVGAYEIVGRGGRLKLLNRQSSLGSATCYLDLDADGKTLVVANYSTGSVASFPVNQDGSLDKASSIVQHHGSSVNPTRQQAPHAHCIVVSPDNRFAFAADLGLDQILSYRLDATTAELSPNQPPFVKTSPGAGPRHLTFHPNARWAYVINELHNSVTRFDYNSGPGTFARRQTISTLPDDFDGTSYCADLKITPNGRFLYATNRGHDSIAAYRIGDDGQLGLLAIQPSLGKGPQNLAVTPGGELLLSANTPGKNVVVFRIDPRTGNLTPAGQPVSMPSPSCIMIRPASNGPRAARTAADIHRLGDR